MASNGNRPETSVHTEDKGVEPGTLFTSLREFSLSLYLEIRISFTTWKLKI